MSLDSDARETPTSFRRKEVCAPGGARSACPRARVVLRKPRRHTAGCPRSGRTEITEKNTRRWWIHPFGATFSPSGVDRSPDVRPVARPVERLSYPINLGRRFVQRAAACERSPPPARARSHGDDGGATRVRERPSGPRGGAVPRAGRPARLALRLGVGGTRVPRGALVVFRLVGRVDDPRPRRRVERRGSRRRRAPILRRRERSRGDVRRGQAPRALRRRRARGRARAPAHPLRARPIRRRARPRGHQVRDEPLRRHTRRPARHLLRQRRARPRRLRRRARPQVRNPARPPDANPPRARANNESGSDAGAPSPEPALILALSRPPRLAPPPPLPFPQIRRHDPGVRLRRRQDPGRPRRDPLRRAQRARIRRVVQRRSPMRRRERRVHRVRPRRPARRHRRDLRTR